MLLEHNADNLFCFFADSLIGDDFKNTQAEKDSLAVKLTAEVVFKSDSIFRDWYNIDTDSLIIHQLAQEINHHPIMDDTGSYYSFRYRESTDLMRYRTFAKIMNSISKKVHERRSNVNTETAFELHLPWTLDDPYIGGQDSTWVDTLLKYLEDPDAFFCVIHEGDTPSYFTKINNVFFSKLNDRKLELRFSFAPTGPIRHLSFSTQYQMFTEIDANIPNNSYLSLYSASFLSGKASPTIDINPDPHWRTLSKFLYRPRLCFVDHFSDWGLDTRLWNSSGTGSVQQDGNEAMIISQDASIINDTSYSMVGTLEATFDNQGESPTQWHRLAAKKDANQMITMYTQDSQEIPGGGMLHIYVSYDSSGQIVWKGKRYEAIQPSGMNNYKIMWNEDCAYFYYNGAYLDYIPFPDSNFNRVKTELATAADGGTQAMKADSIKALDRIISSPRVQITNTSITANPPTAGITYYVDQDFPDQGTYVEVFLERCAWEWGARVELISVQEVDTISWGNPLNASYTFDAADGRAYYKWLVRASGHGGAADSAYGRGIYWDSVSTTLLSSSESEVSIPLQLPKAYALSQNSPNPFNPSTTISYAIPEGKEVSVSLRVYNLRGQLVKTLFEAVPQRTGEYRVVWDGRDGNGLPAASGVYFYRLQAGDFIRTRKMVLLK